MGSIGVIASNNCSGSFSYRIMIRVYRRNHEYLSDGKGYVIKVAKLQNDHRYAACKSQRYQDEY